MAVSWFSIGLGLILIGGVHSQAATLPADWQHEQPFNVPAPGLIKLSLPVATLNAAHPGLEDLRLYDDASNEVPYFIERPAPAGKATRNARAVQVRLNPAATVVTIETGMVQPLDGVTLESPAGGFIKPVKLEGSDDGVHWQTLAQGLPVFRRAGVENLRVPVPSGKWAWLRLTVDDQRSAPVPFTGALVHATAGESAPSESFKVNITDRHENPGETRLTLDLGAANADIASLQIETDEPLFTRPVTLAVPQVTEDSINEQMVAHGVIYRIAVEGQPSASGLIVTLESQIRSRELLLLIRNQDSPPLPIKAVRAERRPVYMVFLAKQAGPFHLLTGNSHATAPHYDLATLGANFKKAAVTPITLPAVSDNPNYHAPEVLAGVQSEGVALDVTAWKFRQAVNLTRAGAQQLELDLNVLSRAQPDFQDLRLVRDGKQVPYIVEHTSITRTLTPDVTATTDAKDKTLSRWTIKLPQPHLPVRRLVCVSPTTLFQRDLVLYEELADERGEKYRHDLGSATWTQTPGNDKKEFALALDTPPRSDTFVLETHNGDNPPIELQKFQFFHPVTRILFKTKTDDAIFLYYGNPQAGAPRYDLAMVAGQLLSADKSSAALEALEQLKKSAWSEGRTPGQGGVIFWGILAVVMVVLLVVISKLLPKPKG